MSDALNVGGEVPIYVVRRFSYTENARVVRYSGRTRLGVTGVGLHGSFLPWPPPGPGLCHPRATAEGDRRGPRDCQRICQRTAHNRAAGGRRAVGYSREEQVSVQLPWPGGRWDADRARLIERIAPLKEELRALFEEAARKSARSRRHRTFAKNLLKLWPARRRHLPQALARQPIRGGRAHDRTAALRLPDLPAAAPLPLHLPRRRAHCQSARRPHPAAHLSSAADELNAYRNSLRCRRFPDRTGADRTALDAF